MLFIEKYFRLQWRRNAQKSSHYVQTVDLIVEDASSGVDSVQGFTLDRILRSAERLPPNGNQINMLNFLQQAKKATNKPDCMGIKVILPACDGHVSRSDMIELRFFGCELVQLACGFVAPRQYVSAFKYEKEQSPASQLQSVLDSAIGAILLKPSSERLVEHALEELELEVKNRLSLQWLLPEPISYKRVAIVGCLPENMSYEGIKAMGIGLVVLDQPGHYLEDPDGPLAYLREAFCPIDLNPDAGLTQRIVDALKGQHVDGLSTRFDVFHTKVAKAAEAMGLPASPPSAYAIATDKYAARALEPDSNSAVCVTSGEEWRQRIHSREHRLHVEYPLVGKPCTGRTSLCVTRTETEADTILAIDKARSRVIRHEDGKPIYSSIMVEPYIDGPEVDVNFAFWDGEVLFSDVSDNWPCAGDATGTPGQNDFQETMFVYPSVLPQSEQHMITISLRDSLLRMGFRTGCFHAEGRVRNSSMDFAKRNGTLDLLPKPIPPSAKSSAFMIEVNPRPPGYFGLHASLWTFGVDYYALHVLHCIANEQRYRSLATPFLNGAQHTSALLLIMPERGGILKSPDPTIELGQKRPDLMECIPLYNNIFKQGQRVTSPDAVDMTYMATAVVSSRKGREDLLKKADEIRANWHVEIE